MINCVYLYLISPLHTGGTTQEGNLVGIAREAHTELPYIPSSTLRGRLRASVEDEKQRINLFGPELSDLKPATEGEEAQRSPNLTQGEIWIGDGSLLWFPVASLSHGVVWITSPMLLRRWMRLTAIAAEIPSEYSTNLVKKTNDRADAIYLKDAIARGNLSPWPDWQQFVPPEAQSDIQRVLLLSDRHCATLIQMSLWRQVKVKLDSHKVVEGGFRYEEAIPPDTLMYFPWGVTSQAKGKATASETDFKTLLNAETRKILQIGGQESLGRGFVQQWLSETATVGGKLA